MATRTLLVADDSQTVQRIIEMACAGEDVDVETVADGERAIARITERPPDIVLADIGMPGLNGYDVAAFVKGRRELAHIPVILLAGMFEAADEVRARDLGCAEVIIKPLKPHHLMERVRHWLDSAPAAARPQLNADVETADGSDSRPSATTAQSAEDYFSRLDAAFKSLERPLGERLGSVTGGSGGSDSTGGSVEAVPTLQELLGRLPEETRTRLTPPLPSAGEKPSTPSDFSVVEAIVARVLDHLSKRDDLLDEIARRVALLHKPDDRR